VPERSLLTDEVRAAIGRATDPIRVRLTPRVVARTMDVYLGHHEDVPAEGAEAPGFAIAGLETESGSLELMDLMPNTLLISNEWTFERPLIVGEEFEARTVLADISERFGGQFGYSLTVRTEVTFTDTTGAIAARGARTMMQYDAAGSRASEEAT